MTKNSSTPWRPNVASRLNSGYGVGDRSNAWVKTTPATATARNPSMYPSRAPDGACTPGRGRLGGATQLAALYGFQTHAIQFGPTTEPSRMAPWPV